MSDAFDRQLLTSSGDRRSLMEMSDSSSWALEGLGVAFFIVIASQAVICAFLSGYVAKEKGYPTETWFVLGLFLGCSLSWRPLGFRLSKATRWEYWASLAQFNQVGVSELQERHPGSIFECKQCGFKLR